MAEKPQLLEHLHWLAHDSFRLDKPLVIYIDPWKLPPGSPTADLILVSHEHFDHCSPEDVEAIRAEHTVVVANQGAAKKLRQPVRVLQPGEWLEHRGVRVEGVAAYNIDKPFHPRQAGHLGFVITLNGERLYFAGDTDHIPEMAEIRCDVALLPVSGTYVMTAEEAARAAAEINPRLAVPMHYAGGVVGTRQDAERFRQACPCPVVLLEAEGGG
jgi:L-ascorbate metabolism protein UlaG (beta-lactamase superfamily)